MEDVQVGSRLAGAPAGPLQVAALQPYRCTGGHQLGLDGTPLLVEEHEQVPQLLGLAGDRQVEPAVPEHRRRRGEIAGPRKGKSSAGTASGVSRFMESPWLAGA